MIDSHIHLFRNGFWRDGGARFLGRQTDADAYHALMVAQGIKGALVIGYGDDGIDPDNNAYLRHLADTYHWISSLAFVRPQTPLNGAELDQILDAGHDGIAVYLADAAAATALASWPAAAWQKLSDRRAIISLNARQWAMPELAGAVAAAPDATFLFAHLGLPGPCHAATKVEAADRLAPLLSLAAAPNVGVKLSGLYALDPTPGYPGAQPFVELLIDVLGPERLFWGSDFSPVLEHSSVADTLRLPSIERLDKAAQDAIMGGNLRRLLSARL
jgi:L-fuconolactonase